LHNNCRIFQYLLPEKQKRKLKHRRNGENRNTFCTHTHSINFFSITIKIITHYLSFRLFDNFTADFSPLKIFMLTQDSMYDHKGHNGYKKTPHGNMALKFSSSAFCSVSSTFGRVPLQNKTKKIYPGLNNQSFWNYCYESAFFI
jgi:hypothetical protein